MAKPSKPGPSPRGRKPESTPDQRAEQAREAKEAAEARDAQASIRDRMVEIGRAENQPGRQKG